LSEDKRLQQLERQVRLLCAALDLRVDDPTTAIPSEVFELVKDGQETQAVQVLRRKGLSLLAGKRIVDAISRD
jgi:hypothetical protein